MAEDSKQVATKVESFYERFHARMDRLGNHWRRHTNRRTLLAAGVFGIGLVAIYFFAIRPPNSFPTGALITIPEGQSLYSISRELQDEHLVRSALAFRLFVTALREDKELHAGDYLFVQPLSLFAVAGRIAHGVYGLEPTRFLIPEGATTAQMADIYAAKLQRFDKADFLSKAEPMEGYLYPDTYFFLPNATASMVIDAMRKNFDVHIAAVSTEIASSTHSLAAIVLMASIIEKEAWDTQDRRMIAGVLWLRLAKGMPLQSDVTLLYTMQFNGSQLSAADFKSVSPYNTYTHKGLPPTPIDSPSMNSIQAALDPIDGGYLYYLADKNGVTHYATTFAQHLSNERLYLGK